MILCLPSNDIPRGREHVSVPAKHLPLLCCPSSSLCHPAHCLMDEADGHGCLPGFRPDSTDTSKREGDRERERRREIQDRCSTVWLPASIWRTEIWRRLSINANELRHWQKNNKNGQKNHASFIFNMDCISCCQFDLFLSFRVSEETLVACERVCSVLNPQ